MPACRGPVHSSSRGVGIESTELTIRSDTLFSALASAVRAVAGPEGLDRLLQLALVQSPPFVVSSTFPWAGELLFYPKPRLLPRVEEPTGQSPMGQSPKEAAWVSAGVLSKMLGGRPVPPDKGVVDPANGVWYLRSEVAALPGEETWWATSAVPRVTVDRQTSASAVYRCGRAWYGPSAGLWCLVEWRDRTWEPTFDAALAFLGESGLGGERSAGHGQFALGERLAPALPSVPDAPLVYSLSLYHPTATEVTAGVLEAPAAYDLEMRRGWVTSPEASGVWRRAVRMLGEGALVRRVAPTMGDLVDVTPVGPAPHPVYRAGFLVGLGAVAPPEGAPAEGASARAPAQGRRGGHRR